MKIINPGTIADAPRWWLGKTFSCANCGCKFQLERTDYHSNAIRFHILCPTCKSLLCLVKPLEPGEKVKRKKPLFEKIFGDGGVFDNIFEKM